MLQLPCLEGEDLEECEFFYEKLLYLLIQRDNRACLDYAIEDGILQGIEKGREEGREEGKAKRNLEIARSMKNKGLDSALIAECTGLSPKEIENL